MKKRLKNIAMDKRRNQGKREKKNRVSQKNNTNKFTSVELKKIRIILQENIKFQNAL